MDETEIYNALLDEFGENVILEHVTPVEERKQELAEREKEVEAMEDGDEKDREMRNLKKEKEEIGYSDSWIEVKTDAIKDVCHHLKNKDELQFDYLMCLSGMDWGEDQLGVTYHLHSMTHQHRVVLKVYCPNEDPRVPSVSEVWGGANWHEREAFDMFGIHFEEHPYLKRIFCPADWEGHPLRKDYEVQEYYRNIRVPY